MTRALVGRPTFFQRPEHHLFARHAPVELVAVATATLDMWTLGPDDVRIATNRTPLPIHRLQIGLAEMVDALDTPTPTGGVETEVLIKQAAIPSRFVERTLVAAFFTVGVDLDGEHLDGFHVFSLTRQAITSSKSQQM